MYVPLQNIIDTVDITPRDALLPLYECIVNSVVSLIQSTTKNKTIDVYLYRGADSKQLFSDIKTINKFVVKDNGIGFTAKNFKSFETPFSKLLNKYGGKGVGRFTVLATYKSIRIKSNYYDDEKWKYREFLFDPANEIKVITPIQDSSSETPLTEVEVSNCYNEVIKDRTAITTEQVALQCMEQLLIYYLSGKLPLITIHEQDSDIKVEINDLYKKVSKDHERVFQVKEEIFKAYITKTEKEGNRKNHYIHYCANSRTVGQPKSIGRVDSLFSYPLERNNKYYFLDVYLVSNYLDKKVYKTRNGFAIPFDNEDTLFDSKNEISFYDIEKELVTVLEKEYKEHVKATKERNKIEVVDYITKKAPRFRSLINNPGVMNSIPPNLSDDKKEEHLYRASFNARKSVERKLQDFIENKQINEETINQIKNDIREKTAYDVDSLADYMMRRKAIIDLFDKFLEADSEGKYKLEQDIHNLIFPIGLTNDEVSYESHNLWLLDERFLTYKFVASDKSITSMSQKSSSKEPDIIMLNDNPIMFENPIGFADKSNGELNSMVIFEFKRPGQTAHQKNKKDYRWEFSDLVEPYFDDFLYSPDKKNYKGKHVIIRKETPKFGFIIIDVLPPLLEQYNIDKGWQKTPFGTFYKMISNKNMHLEVMTFNKLIEYAKNRHTPFFDKLFGN